MPHACLRALRSSAAAALAAPLLAVPTATAGQAPAASHTARAGSTGHATQVLLITGDRLLVSPGSPGTAVIEQPAGEQPGTRPNGFLFDNTCSRSLKIPDEALPYLGRGLDPALFQLTELERAERDGRLPVRLTYPGARPAVPGITVTRTGQGAADGYLTAASARLFGAALRRQFAADHSRDSYGTRGLFAHGLSVGLAGAPAPPAQPQFPMRTLTVTGSNLAGQPDTGDPVMIFNLDNCTKLDPVSSVNTFFHGTAKFSVPAGHYWAAVMFPSRLVILPQFTVEHPTTVHASERAASSKITVRTPRPARLVNTAFNLLRTDHGRTEGVSWLNYTFGRPLRISLLRHRPSIGQLHAYTQADLFSPPGHGTSYAYVLDFPAPPGIVPPQHYAAHPARLATVHEHYFKDTKVSVVEGGLGGWVTFGGTPAEAATGIISSFVNLLPMPGRQTQYLSAAPRMLWQTDYLPYFLFDSQTGPLRPYHPGQVSEDWGRYPLHLTPNASLPGARQADARIYPSMPSASRARNTLSLDITPFGDNQPGDIGSGYEGDSCEDFRFACHGTYALYQNGTEIAHGDAAARGTPDLLLQARLSPKPSLIRFVLTADRSGHKEYLLSAASRDVWTWRSRPEPNATVPAPWHCHQTGLPPVFTGQHCAVQDMTMLRYRVAGLTLTGVARPGRQHIAITASHIQLAPTAPLTHASMQVSFDSGKTWHPATVSKLSNGRFRAEFTAPASTKVTLRTHVAGAHGVSVTETINNAYQVTAP